MRRAGQPGPTATAEDTGHRTLEAFAQAPRFNRWMADRLRPWLGVRVAELGSGMGNISAHLLERGPVLLTDADPRHMRSLRERWGTRPGVRIEPLDMTSRPDLDVLARFKPDTVVFLNVLEHVADDAEALRGLYEVMPDDGRLVVLVPFGKALYSDLDHALGHHRRYGPGELEQRLRDSGFEVEHQEPFNKAGRLPWYLQLTLGGGRRLPGWELRLYDRAVPVLRLLDRVLPGPGLSTIVVARKTAVPGSQG